MQSALDIGGHGISPATKGVDEAIKKARRAFFAYGAMGAFQGKLNPLSGKTIFDTCVVPVPLLSKVSSEGESIGCCMYTSLTIADPLSLRLMQECLSLESKLNCHGATDLVLKTDNNSQDLRGIKKLVFESDCMESLFQ